jgi:hypothetical protein
MRLCCWKFKYNFEEVTKLLFTILKRVSVSTFKINTVSVNFFYHFLYIIMFKYLYIFIYIYFLLLFYAVIKTKVVFVTVNSKKENVVSLNRNSNRFSVKFSELVSVFIEVNRFYL